MEVEKIPEGEREEVRQIFTKKGLAPHLADRLTEIVASNKDVWVELMMTEELGIAPKGSSSPLEKRVGNILSFCRSRLYAPDFLRLLTNPRYNKHFRPFPSNDNDKLFIVVPCGSGSPRRNWLRSGLKCCLQEEQRQQ